MFNKIKALFAKKPSRLEVLEEKIKDLEKRIFKEKKADKDDFFGPSIMSYYLSFHHFEPKPLEEEWDETTDKVNLIAKHLGIVFAKTEEKESELVLKKLRGNKRKV